MTIRPIDSANEAEVRLVAERMRLTLKEVVGPARGESMYAMEWLIDRVRFHLDGRCDGAVFVAEEDDIVGHSIVRIEDGFGLFSTFYVDPEHRREGIARVFIDAGEAWMRERGIAKAKTNTAADNWPLHRLLESSGYAIELRSGEMVCFAKAL